MRQQIPQDAATDEEVEVVGADRAFRLTYLDLPGQQEGQPDTGITLVLVEEAGFDPDSEVPDPLQAPAPAP